MTTTETYKCPICKQPLIYLMPSGTILYCNHCDKHFENNNDQVGKETNNPYIRDDVLY